jgi:hypothetical protein
MFELSFSTIRTYSITTSGFTDRVGMLELYTKQFPDILTILEITHNSNLCNKVNFIASGKICKYILNIISLSLISATTSVEVRMKPLFFLPSININSTEVLIFIVFSFHMGCVLIFFRKWLPLDSENLHAAEGQIHKDSKQKQKNTIYNSGCVVGQTTDKVPMALTWEARIYWLFNSPFPNLYQKALPLIYE